MSSSPLVNSLVKNRLFKTAPDIDEPPFQFIHTTDLSVVDTMLHDSPDLVIHRTEIWAVWRPQAGHKKVWRFLTHACFFIQRERRSRCLFCILQIVNCNFPWKSFGYKADSVASCCRSAKFYYATNVFIKINMPSAESNFSEKELNLLK